MVALTGAGVSAESGLNTFRGAGGWWRHYRAEHLATPEAFAADPALVHEFYNMRRRKLLAPEVAPNPAHDALARFEQDFIGRFVLITQNIDDLHERAGSKNLLHMHGELLKCRCLHCGHVTRCEMVITVADRCDQCQTIGGLRPHVVWFGESPFYLNDIAQRLAQCDLFIAIGTSGNVYPAAGFVQLANAAGAHTVELNLEPTKTGSSFKEQLHGPASELVPKYLSRISPRVNG